MNFVYDILVNFNNELYDFYDWNTSDTVTHLRKIPLFKIKTEDLEKIKNYNLKFETNFLEKIKTKAERFTSRKTEVIDYASLFTDGFDVIALKFNNDGITTQISKLLIDEEEEIIDISNRCNEYNLNYEILNKKEVNTFKTRKQLEKKKYLLKSIKQLELDKDFDKLKYLYFECFDKKEESIKLIIKNLKNAIENDKSEKIMYDFFKLISIN